MFDISLLTDRRETPFTQRSVGVFVNRLVAMSLKGVDPLADSETELSLLVLAKYSFLVSDGTYVYVPFIINIRKSL